MKVWSDGGHGGKDSGATYGAIKEKDLTLDIDNKISNLLTINGYKVYRTRTKDTYVHPNQRGKMVKQSKADICISSHINMGGGSGAEIFISQYNKDLALPQLILENLKNIGLNTERGIKTRKLTNGQDYYYMHRLTGNVKTLIIEYGFLDNKQDREFLLEGKNRFECAKAVVKAICEVDGKKFVEDKKEDVYYRVVTGSYKDRSLAEKRVKELEKKGFSSFIDIYRP